MRCFEGPDLGFLLCQFCSRLLQLILEKGRRALRELLLHFQIFVDEERSELGVHVLSKLRRRGRIGYLKRGELSGARSGVDDVYLYVYAHSFHGIAELHEPTQTSRRWVEME